MKISIQLNCLRCKFERNTTPKRLKNLFTDLTIVATMVDSLSSCGMYIVGMFKVALSMWKTYSLGFKYKNNN